MLPSNLEPGDQSRIQHYWKVANHCICITAGCTYGGEVYAEELLRVALAIIFVDAGEFELQRLIDSMNPAAKTWKSQERNINSIRSPHVYPRLATIVSWLRYSIVGVGAVHP